MAHRIFPLIALASVYSSSLGAEARSFVVQNDAFMRDGSPFQIRSGSLHYHRVHPAYWKDRLQRMAALGLNTVQTYVPWNFHETSDGVFDFSGMRDVAGFFRAVNESGMLLLLRPGPYICGEHDFGGLPPYLLNVTDMVIRTNNTQYLYYVDRWWQKLLPLVVPFLYKNGGPITSIQIENEFGWYGNAGSNPGDREYLQHLQSLAQSVLGKNSVILYTTDPSQDLFEGTLPGSLLATVDFGPTLTPNDHFIVQNSYNPYGWQVNMNSEYYPGWLTHWGEQMANTSSLDTAAGISAILALNASINIYMAHGGTNWGFFNGANGGGAQYQPVITSYDYDAPISEGGEHGYGPDGDKYIAMQQVFAYWAKETFPKEPPLLPRVAYGALQMTQTVSFFDALPQISTAVYDNQQKVHNMEYYGQSQGFILYRTTMPAGLTGPANITFAGFGDRVKVFVNQQLVGTSYRPTPVNIVIPASLIAAGGVVDIFVENMGHINFSHGMTDPKGLLGEVSIGGTVLGGPWQVYTLPFDFASVEQAKYVPWSGTANGMQLYRASLNISKSADTYLALCGWGKGVVYINGFNIGKYWESMGPQHALYIPAPFLQVGANDVVIFELEHADTDASVAFVGGPDFTGAVCGSHQQATANIAKDTPHKALGSAGSAVQACRAPGLGTNITLQTCGSVNNADVFAFFPVKSGVNAGRIQLKSDTTLCVGVSGINADTGYPNLALVKCNAYDQTQVFLWFQQLTGGLMSVTSGMFVDLTGGNTASGTHIELYANNGGLNNQRWQFDSSAGRFYSMADSSRCLAAC